MRQANILLRNLSLYPRKFLSPSTLNSNLNSKTILPIPNYNNLALPISQSSFHFRFFTSNSKPDSSVQSSNHPLEDRNLDETDDGKSVQVEDVSNEELKMQIDRYYKGDEGALKDIFEAIVRRKLAGKHGEESDDEILKEFQLDDPQNGASDDEVDSDFDDTDLED